MSWGRTRRAIAETWSKTSRTSRALARAGPRASSSRCRRSLSRSSSARRSCSSAAERMSAIAFAAFSSSGENRAGVFAESQRSPRGTWPRTIGATRMERVPESRTSLSARRDGSRTVRASSIRRVPVAEGQRRSEISLLSKRHSEPAETPGVAIPHDRSAGPSTILTTPAESNGRTRRAASATRAKTSGSESVSATIRAISVRTPTSGSAARGEEEAFCTKGGF